MFFQQLLPPNPARSAKPADPDGNWRNCPGNGMQSSEFIAIFFKNQNILLKQVSK